MRPTTRMGRAMLQAVSNWKWANRLLLTGLDAQITNAKQFLEDLSAMKPWPGREQGIQLCILSVEKELRHCTIEIF